MFKVYGVANCPDCKAAVLTLAKAEIKHVYFDARNVGSPTRAEFEDLAGRAIKTVPIIIKSDNGHQTLERGDEFIGSFADLKKHLEEEKQRV